MPKSPIDKATPQEVDWQRVAPIFEACRKVENPSYVYFIGEEGQGHVKIGKATDPVHRLRNMQVGNPRRLKVERVLAGDQAIERLLHELWSEYAVLSERAKAKKTIRPGTEWFNPEIREELFPIVDSAVSMQLDLLENPSEQGIDLGRLEWMVRQAHIDAGHAVRITQPVYKMASVMGYEVVGASRV